MKILFVHQNFPGQFRHVAPALAQNPDHDVRALSMRVDLPSTWQGVKITPYTIEGIPKPRALSWLTDFEVKTVRAEACYRAALELSQTGFVPDVIVTHPGWGESLYLKTVWPDAKLLMYAEFYYHMTGLDVGFDPEQTPSDPASLHRFALKNINNLLHFQIADGGISPTKWQASTFPSQFQEKITVIHDGIDTERLRPDPSVSIRLQSGQTLTRADEVITFISRDLEPYRGYHIFMRALPELLKRRPHATIIIVGGTGTNYGPRPAEKTWAEIFAAQAKKQISDADWARVHFLGKIPYEQYISVLQLSRVHLYWTYPFVLSWSLLEAMSCGAVVVGSDTGPVQELITDKVTGRLVPFFDIKSWLNVIDNLLIDDCLRQKIACAAREHIVHHYDLRTICVPKQVEWIERCSKSITLQK
jgi:glycosyltransferase involved in cell wall biosynthesis